MDDVNEYVNIVDTRTEEQVTEDMDDVDYREQLMDDLLTHVAKTGHALSIVNVGFAQSHEQTFVLCTGCDAGLDKNGEAIVAINLKRTRYARNVQRELNL